MHRFSIRHRFLAAAGALPALAACGATETTSIDRFTENGRLIALSGGKAGASNACFTCHGLDGRGNGAGAPRLAGLNTGYLDRQLIAYTDGRRDHPEMGWIAKHLSTSERLKVSAFYAAMPYEPEPVPEQVPQLGRRLYMEGAPDRGIAPCAACHGESGQGIGPGNPPLGGQPAAYLAEQIHKWRHSKRRNDPGNVMLEISLLLRAPEIEAVSAYAAALPGDLPRPEYRAASREERRAGPRSGALEPLPHALVSE